METYSCRAICAAILVWRAKKNIKDGELTKNPAALFDAEGEEMSFNRVDEALKSVGISMQTVDHQFRSFTEVITELADKWNTLDSVQQRYIATQFAGK